MTWHRLGTALVYAIVTCAAALAAWNILGPFVALVMMLR